MTHTSGKLKQAFLVSIWIGVSMVVAAYILLSAGWLQIDSLAYGVLNAFGALIIVASMYMKRDFQPVLLHVVWLLLAIFGIFRAIAAIS
jgi:hypothetical protein